MSELPDEYVQGLAKRSAEINRLIVASMSAKEMEEFKANCREASETNNMHHPAVAKFYELFRHFNQAMPKATPYLPDWVQNASPTSQTTRSEPKNEFSEPVEPSTPATAKDFGIKENPKKQNHHRGRRMRKTPNKK